MLSNERANDIASTLKGKKLAFSSGWASAVKGKVFSETVKSQKISKPMNKSRSRSPAHDLEDMQAMLAAKRFNFIDEL